MFISVSGKDGVGTGQLDQAILGSGCRCRGDVHCDLREPCWTRRWSRLRALDRDVCGGDYIHETLTCDCERLILTPVAGADASPQLHGAASGPTAGSDDSLVLYTRTDTRIHILHTHAHSPLLYRQLPLTVSLYN